MGKSYILDRYISIYIGGKPMLDLEKILAHNKEFLATTKDTVAAQELTSKPSKKLAIVSCMDTRLVAMMEEALGYKRGEVIEIKTAGNGVTAPLDNVVQSLLVAHYGMGVEDVLVVGHENCGMIDFNATEFIKKMEGEGISSDAIRMIEFGLIEWMDRFCVSEDNVKFTLERLRNHPLFPKTVHFYGGMIDPTTGAFKVVEVD
jgi:hypothetical protein